MKDKQLTIKEKIEKIQTSESFEDLKTGWFPQSASTSYYFVSYCHKDYKKVFVDILGMQQYDSEIAVWYDRELNVGRDWEKEAKTHINDFDCLGVIFYISENSVESPAIFKEMQMAIDADKPFIPIVLPVENIRSKAGEYLSGAELLDILFPRLSEDDEKYKLYHEMFGKNILYFKDTDSPQEKTERMKKSFTRQPLLELESTEDAWGWKRGIAVVAVNNINIIEVNEDDYRLLDENNQPDVNEDVYGFWGDNNQPLDILRIGKCAFSNCKQLESIIIPKTVKYIDEFAFYNCSKLKTVKLSEDSSLESFGDSVFLNCQNLVNITLPNGIKNINNQLFSGCSSLTSITIPNSVISIGKRAFNGCENLTNITIPNSVTGIGEFAFFGCSRLTNIMIPSGITSIGQGAFVRCSSLTSITIPNSVTSIGEFAFNCCENLTSITIPNSITSIREGTFSVCENLTSITIPNSVTSIGEFAFNSCENLTNITIPNSVTSIGGSAFSGCSRLTNITIPNSVTSIGAFAFNCCSDLTSITIPNSITSIGVSAFSGCENLTSIMFEGTTEEWGKISERYLGFEHRITVTCTDGITIKNPL